MSELSQELTALSQAAISRMSPYQLANRAVILRAKMHNGLDIEPLELEGGRTLYAVTSGLVATCIMRQETVVEEDELVRRQFVPLPLTVFADVVELKSPAGRDKGDARLYRIEEPVVTALAEVRRAFRDTALEVLTKRGPNNEILPPIRFDGISNTFYDVCVGIDQPDETYMSSARGTGGAPVQADERTQIHLKTVGKDELSREIGVLATVSGPARITLDKRHFVRITNTGIFYGPSGEKTVGVDIPPDTPQYHINDYHRIPDDATVGFNESGDIVPQGPRADGRKYEYAKLNPYISPAIILKLMPPGTIDWTDGTTAFIQSVSDHIARMMPLDAQAFYEQTLSTARDKVREAMLAIQDSKAERVGCLAVTDRLAELPATIDNTKRVDAKFFGINT